MFLYVAEEDPEDALYAGNPWRRLEVYSECWVSRRPNQESHQKDSVSDYIKWILLVCLMWAGHDGVPITKPKL
jgi:hypothetical protein